MNKRYEIVFLAHYPNCKDKNINGMDVRVQAIDTIFKDVSRCYIESGVYPFKNFLYYLARDIKHWNFSKKFYNDENLNTLQYVDKKKYFELFENARIIYIHSLFNTRKLPQFLLEKYGHKIFLDIHGCVPEEQAYQQKCNNNVNKFEIEEQRIFKYVKNFISVSEQMVNFYKNKYPQTKDANYIVAPIFSLNENASYQKEQKSEKKIKIIYPGDCSKWQNADLMLQTIAQFKRNPNYKFSIFSKQAESFQELAQKYDCADIRIESKTQKEIFEEYKNHHFGFILRDDILVNRIACPTKLIEYMQNGIIPIVLQPEIGDFNMLGYKYILKDDLINGHIPSLAEQEDMRKRNYEIIQSLNQKTEDAKLKLLNFNKG